MKAQSASLSLYHILPGHHREATMWHDADHKAEVVGAMDNIFISQRWVTPPEWLSLRQTTLLAEGGGEYVNLYWSSGTTEELERDFGRLGDALTLVGRMEPATKYMRKTWPTTASGRMKPLLLLSRPGLELSGEAVPASTAMTGLMTRVEMVHDDEKRESFNRWHEQEYIPMVLDTGLFAGAAKLALDPAAEDGQYVTLYYLDADSPADAYQQFKEISAQWDNDGKLSPQKDAAHEVVFESLSRPSIGHYDFYE
jgi:hypothetical protein